MVNILRAALVSLILVSSVFTADAARPRKQPVDTVGLHCRGVMETFSKVSEGLDKRLDFSAGAGLPHYFYCPSDDRYCNRWGWKFLYNDSDRHHVRALNALCV